MRNSSTQERGAKDEQTVTSEWQIVRELIAGVQTREVKNVPTERGITTELYRQDWKLDTGEIVHAIHVSLRPGSIAAWHYHARQTDHIFCVDGVLKLVLYDDRPDSPTRGMLNVFHLASARPYLVVIPPFVWHGIQNPSHRSSNFVNLFNRQYAYEDPDEWRLPADTDQIPYRF